MILLVVDLVVLNMAVLHIHGPARLVLGLVFSLFVPGWAVVGPIRLGDAALEIALTMAASLALLMLTAQVLMSFQIWHLVAFEEVTCLLCLPSLVWQSMDLQRSTGNPSQ